MPDKRKSQKSAGDEPPPPEVRDEFARKLAKWSFIVAAAGLGVSTCQAWVGYQALQDNRESAVKIETQVPTGHWNRPEVGMKVSNLTNRPMKARISGRLALLPPEGAAQIYNNMNEFATETIQAQDSETQHLWTPKNFSDGQLKAWDEGDLVLIGALKVTWKDKGAWFSTKATRCWAWTRQRAFACEDLIENPNASHKLVENVLRQPPQEGPMMNED